MADRAQDQILNQPVQLVMGVKPGYCIRCQNIRLSQHEVEAGIKVCMFCSEDIARQAKMLANKAALAAEKASKAG